MNREAVPRSRDKDYTRKLIDLVIRIQRMNRKRNDKMYRQQSVQKQVIGTTGGNNDEYDTGNEGE